MFLFNQCSRDLLRKGGAVKPLCQPWKPCAPKQEPQIRKDVFFSIAGSWGLAKHFIGPGRAVTPLADVEWKLACSLSSVSSEKPKSWAGRCSSLHGRVWQFRAGSGRAQFLVLCELTVQDTICFEDLAFVSLPLPVQVTAAVRPQRASGARSPACICLLRRERFLTS